MSLFSQARLATIARYLVALFVIGLTSLAASLLDFLALMLNLCVAGYREYGTVDACLFFATNFLEGQAGIIADGLAAGLVSLLLAAAARGYREQFLRGFVSATAILVAFELSSEPPLMIEFLVFLGSDLLVGLLIGLLVPFPASYLARVFRPSTSVPSTPALPSDEAMHQSSPLGIIEAIVILLLAAVWIIVPETTMGRFASWAIVSLSAVAAWVKIRGGSSREK